MKRALVLVVLALATTGCVRKKNKPPPIRFLAMGEQDACAQLVSGQDVCWGRNDAGQVGDGTRERRLYPTPVKGDLGKVTSFAVANAFTCAMASAGTVTCWGRNADGVLGPAATGDVSGPVRLPLEGVDLLVTGSWHGCARGKGGVRCWGRNYSGQLGDGTVETRSVPVEPLATKGARVVAMGAGGAATCFAIERDDPTKSEVRCVGGLRAVNALGEGNDALARDGFSVLRGVPVAQVATNESAGCAVTKSGELWCWGDDEGGRRLAPKEAARVDLPEAAAEVHVGRAHACVRTRSGTVACWGANLSHQLADGTVTPSDRPKPVYGLATVEQLAVSGFGACALLKGGEARCWGDNDEGQLGDGTREVHNVPMPIKAAPLEPAK